MNSAEVLSIKGLNHFPVPLGFMFSAVTETDFSAVTETDFLCSDHLLLRNPYTQLLPLFQEILLRRKKET